MMTLTLSAGHIFALGIAVGVLGTLAVIVTIAMAKGDK